MMTLQAKSVASIEARGASRRRTPVWRLPLAGAVLIGLLGALLPLGRAAAVGPIWLPTQQATFSKVINESVSMATYRDHAYILWLEGDLSHSTNYWVYYTTNASGAWTTRLLSKAGPGTGGVLDQYRAVIAVDPTLKRLYAVWPLQLAHGGELVLYTSDDEGTTWQGPTTLAQNAVASIFPNMALAAGGGKAAVAFDAGASNYGKGACTDVNNAIPDIYVVTYSGSTWSPPQNVSSCVSGQSGGFRTQRLAYDETTGRFSLVGLDETNDYRLWSAQGSGTKWSTPALTPMTHLVTGAGDNGGGLYQIAAAGGTTYVAYALSTKPGTGFSYVDVFLGIRHSGQGWTTQRITQDPLNCQKADVSVAARPNRITLAYRWFYGNCAKPEPPSGPRADYIHVLTGQPGHFQEIVPFKPPVPSNCLRPLLSTDGDIFRVLQMCSNNTTAGENLYYTPEYLDVVGPATQITGLSSAGAGLIHVGWTAQDPTPGSGVAYYQVQVRVDGGAWQNVVAATQSLFIVYTKAQAGHTYTFRVRARDKVNNWGAWVTATLKVT